MKRPRAAVGLISVGHLSGGLSRGALGVVRELTRDYRATTSQTFREFKRSAETRIADSSIANYLSDGARPETQRTFGYESSKEEEARVRNICQLNQYRFVIYIYAVLRSDQR